ncbi:MAG TPA: ABC transporter permease [Vicinamibacterales bacterium]|jgi:putative ABC transport system permease protein
MTAARLFHAAPDLKLGLESLLLHKLRSLLTMLGMIFGVAAVVSMLSIGAGAQQQVMAFIEDLGVRNLIVEAREAGDRQALDRVRKRSAGLSFQDLRVIRANVDQIAASTARKKFAPSKMLPRPQGEMPTVYGVDARYQEIARLRLTEGRFFDATDMDRAAAVCVLGQSVRVSLFGAGEAVGEYLKANEQWYRVIGVVEPQVSAQTDVAGVPAQDRNNLVYVPLAAAVLRTEDSYSYLRDEIDGIYMQMQPTADPVATATVVRGILSVAHGQADDFSVIVPAELLAQQRRTQRVFDMVMVALASISLLVGGIGIMNIMLATILERTREIGTRRAVGARRGDIVRQFLVETILISFVGGVLGILFGVGMSRLIAWLAGWSTIVTLGSILLAFLVSVSVGLVFGVYPAIKAARLDPVEALHSE